MEHRINAEKNSSSGHAVTLMNSHGMDVVLRKGSIEYRVLGGTLDFYFVTADSPTEVISEAGKCLPIRSGHQLMWAQSRSSVYLQYKPTGLWDVSYLVSIGIDAHLKQFKFVDGAIIQSMTLSRSLDACGKPTYRWKRNGSSRLRRPIPRP